jgi:predicted dienelactone hydrolase
MTSEATRQQGRAVIVFILTLAVASLWMASRRHTFRPVQKPLPITSAAPTVAPPLSNSRSHDHCLVAVGYRVIHVKDRVVAVWYPTNASPSRVSYSPKFSGTLAKDAPPSKACGEKVPLIVFSHGYLGCGIQSVFFTETLARSGYVVAAPDHADAAMCKIHPSAQTEERTAQLPQLNILLPQTWSEASRLDRRQDIENVIDEMLESKEFAPVIDAQKIGLAGHSLGGYTVVAMAGGWPTWTDDRVRAVLGLSPYVMPFQLKNTLSNVRVPLMYQGGTLDFGITPFLMGPKGAYAAANAPAYFVEVRNGTHLAWVNCGDEQDTESCMASVKNAQLIAQYGVAFFDRHLKGLQEPILDQQNPGLAEYSFRSPHP